MHISEANRRYETSLRATFDNAVVEADLIEKHDKMAKSAFQFLRATCFRWAAEAQALLPNLSVLAAVGTVVDAHVGNFGLWRDSRMRLVWGVNDYDEAALAPWPFDIVRLATSANLAFADPDPDDIVRAILRGYREGLDAPSARVLERDHLWLRDAFTASDDERISFWKKLDKAEPAACRPSTFEAPLRAALGDATDVRIVPRSAGVGSLGRPRFVAIGRAAGGPVAVEIKGVMPSAWISGRREGLAERLAHGCFRSGDPTHHYSADHVVRRLAPDSGKVAFDKLARVEHPPLVRAMAADLGAIHAQGGSGPIIARELAGLDADWLLGAARRTTLWTRDDWADFKDRYVEGT